MDDSELRGSLRRFYRFAWEFVARGSSVDELSAALAAAGDDIAFDISVEHVAALKDRSLSGHYLWELSSLLQDVMAGMDVPAFEFRRARHHAFLEIQLFDATFGQSDDDLAPSQRDIMATIRKAGRRLVTNEIIRLMDTPMTPASEGTIKPGLSTLVKLNRLNNKRSSKPPGYGLPGWP
jgi:hypothetical protein